MSSRPDPRLTPHRTAGLRPVRAPHPVRPAMSLSATAVAPAATPLAFAARAAATVAGLRIDPDGTLTEVAVPLRATTWALAEFTDTAAGPAGLETLTLDRDLLAWVAQPDTAQPTPSGRRVRHNPVASVAAAMFGSPGPLHGPVVFTGRRPDGQLDHISVAAVVLLAGTAASCDPHDPTGSRAAARAAEFARLGVHIADPTDPTQPADPAAEASLEDEPAALEHAGSYDSQRHTAPGADGWPRCLGCAQITVLGHDEHHPDAGATDPTPVSGPRAGTAGDSGPADAPAAR